MAFALRGAFAEFERSLIRERQREGIALAKQRKVYKGRVPALNPEKAAELRRRAAEGEPKTKLARDLGISRATVYTYLRAQNETNLIGATSAPRADEHPAPPVEQRS